MEEAQREQSLGKGAKAITHSKEDGGRGGMVWGAKGQDRDGQTDTVPLPTPTEEQDRRQSSLWGHSPPTVTIPSAVLTEALGHLGPIHHDSPPQAQPTQSLG